MTIGERWKVTDAVLKNCILCSTYVFSRNIGRKSDPTHAVKFSAVLVSRTQ